MKLLSVEMDLAESPSIRSSWEGDFQANSVCPHPVCECFKVSQRPLFISCWQKGTQLPIVYHDLATVFLLSHALVCKCAMNKFGTCSQWCVNFLNEYVVFGIWRAAVKSPRTWNERQGNCWVTGIHNKSMFFICLLISNCGTLQKIK